MYVDLKGFSKPPINWQPLFDVMVVNNCTDPKPQGHTPKDLLWMIKTILLQGLFSLKGPELEDQIELYNLPSPSDASESEKRNSLLFPFKKHLFEIYSVFILFLSICTFFISCSNTEELYPQAPKGLTCELLRAPDEAVITDPQPEFGWIVHDSRRGAMQSGWQILVGSDKELIQNDQGDMWNSGKTDSDQSTNISYAGKPLQPNSVYWWKVRAWSDDGKASPYSKTQRFNTGDFETSRSWPGESRWVTISDENGEQWVLENRQRSSYHEREPVNIISESNSHYFLDFGKAAFATLKLTLTSPKEGHTVEIRLGEKRTADNRVDENPGGSIVYKKVTLELSEGTHTYIVKLPRQYSDYPNSQVLAEHMPEVTSFRYAEILNSPSELAADDIRQYALIYFFDDEASFFKSSNDTLNQIWDLCKYTLKQTPFLGVYADGTRERMPYEADAYIQQISHYAVDREYAIGRYTHEFLIFNPSWPTEWHLHSVLMAWADYQYTGNTESIERYYDELKAKTLLALARQDGLISTRTGLVTDEFLESIHFEGTNFRDIVDWPQGTPYGTEENRSGFNAPIEGETDRYVFTDINTVVNAFHYHNLILMGKMAEAVGKVEDVEFYRKRAQKVKASFNEVLFDQERGIYVDGEGTDHAALHANMFPLAFGLVPDQHVESVVEFIKSRGMAASPYGAQYLLEALYEGGASQHALELMTSKSDRSWYNMIRVGSTMTTEAWDIKYKSNLGWNHAWGASPANIIVRKLMGIEPIEPAFKKIQIKPQPGSLQTAELKTPTIKGTIYAKFNREPEGVFTLEVVIPANTNARVLLPKPDKEDFTLRLNGNEIPFTIEDESVLIDNLEAGRHLLELQ